MFNGDIKFKGVSSKTYPLTITSPPKVTHSEIKGDIFSVPGRDGDLYGKKTYRGSATITVQMALVSDDYQETLRTVRSWLSGTGKLILGDVTDSYYEVQRVVINTDERIIVRYGTLEAVFTVYPYEFLDTGDTGVTTFPITNGADRSHPLYKIGGTGSGTLTVNDHAMTFEVNGTLYIDTRRYIAYDGSNNNANGNLSGDYDGLVLENGSNTISITSGFTLTVYPKWGYII